MINIDEDIPVRDALAGLAQPLKTRAIRGDDTVKFHSWSWFLEQAVAIKKAVFIRDDVLIPANHAFAFALQGQRQADLRADTIAVGPDMSDDAERFILADRIQDAVDDSG